MSMAVSNFKAMSKKEKIVYGIFFCLAAMLMAGLIFNVAMAGSTNPAATQVSDILKKMLDIVCMIFQAVGIVLSIYAIGQLIMAFKNEDADSKSKASTMLVVGVCLIALPTIATSVGVFNNFGTGGNWSSK